jgi:hypothetical protein
MRDRPFERCPRAVEVGEPLRGERTGREPRDARVTLGRDPRRALARDDAHARGEPERGATLRRDVVEQHAAVADRERAQIEVERRRPCRTRRRGRHESIEVRVTVGVSHEMQRGRAQFEPLHAQSSRQQRPHVEIE